jgi:hypothetical protein
MEAFRCCQSWQKPPTDLLYDRLFHEEIHLVQNRQPEVTLQHTHSAEDLQGISMSHADCIQRVPIGTMSFFELLMNADASTPVLSVSRS